MQNRLFVSAPEAGRRCGVARATVHRWCQDHPRFAVWVTSRWRVPVAHVERLLAGETPEAIASSPSVGAAVDPAHVPEQTSDASATVRDRLATAFLFARALHLHDDLATDRRLDVLSRLADELLDAMADLGLPPEDLREAILKADACAAYRQISGFPVEV